MSVTPPSLSSDPWEACTAHSLLAARGEGPALVPADGQPPEQGLPLKRGLNTWMIHKRAFASLSQIGTTSLGGVALPSKVSP